MLKQAFYLSQIFIGVLFIALAFFFRSRKTRNFRPSESVDRTKTTPQEKLESLRIGHTGANTGARPKTEAPREPKIRIDGAPHEILGVTQEAKTREIKRAFRTLMKRHHPDKVARQGTREWQDAQKVAAAINDAKNRMLRRK